MNFRNISSWCIRNPVFPIVLFYCLHARGPDRLCANAGEQRTRHRFPGGRRGSRPARRRAERDGNADNAAGRKRHPRRERCRGDEQHCGRGRQRHLRPVPAGDTAGPCGERCPQRDRADPGHASGRDSRAAGHARRRGERANLLRGRADHGHDARAAELVHRRYGSETIARLARDRRRPARRRSRPNDPGNPQPRCLAIAGDHRGRGQPAASPKQHERRRRQRPRSPGRSRGSGPRQCQHRLCARPDTDRPARRAIRQARRSRRGQGQQFRATLAREDERPSGRDLHDPASERVFEVTAYQSLWKELHAAREGRPADPLLRGFHQRRLHQGAVQVRDGRA